MYFHDFLCHVTPLLSVALVALAAREPFNALPEIHRTCSQLLTGVSLGAGDAVGLPHAARCGVCGARLTTVQNASAQAQTNASMIIHPHPTKLLASTIVG